MAAQQLLASWLAAAWADPTAPDTAPIFALAQLAADQDPPVNLSDPTGYQPQDLQLGLLDLNVLFAGIAQVAPFWRGSQAAPATPSVAQAALRQMAASATPCTNLVSFLDGWVPMAGQAFGFGAGTAVGSVVQNLAAQLSQFLGASAATAAAQAAAFGQLLSTLGLLGQLSALSELYTHTTAKVSSDNGPGPSPSRPSRPLRRCCLLP